jgi:hypothetical protein
MAMMRCPACGEWINYSYEKEQLRCSACGWGTGEPASVPTRARIRRRAVRATNLTSVTLLWLASITITALAAWIVFGLLEVSPTDEYIWAFLGCLVAYGVVGYFIQPAADEAASDSLLGDAWSHLYGDDMILLSILLFPGRLIALAFLQTVRLVLQTTRPPSSTGRAGR